MIQTERLLIRKFELKDIDNAHALLSDEKVMRYIEPPYSREEAEEFLQEAGLCEPPLVFAVDDKNGKFVGYVIYHLYEENSFEIGWVLCRKEWNRGYAQELTEALIKDATGKTDYLVIECVPEQTATKRIALHNSFAYVGMEDDCEVYKLKL